MRIQRLLLLLFITLFLNNQGNAFDLTSQAEISVITCSPGDEAYSVYGHSAIRVKDESRNYDMVFNYGIFDFGSTNFIYRFAKGQTDYLLGVYPFSVFLKGYVEEQRNVYEQVLNLKPGEKQKIFDFLLWNALPENRVYRYNFFFDNCATRVRDVVAQNIDGGIEYSDKETGKTFRTLIKDYHGRFLWLNFGIDFLVSADSDRKATLEEEMFLPDYVMKHFAGALRGDNRQSLVSLSQIVFQAPDKPMKENWLTGPFAVFSLFFIVVLVLTIRQFRKGKLRWFTDFMVYGLNGLGGLLIAWFALYSEHPAMSPNFNLFWLVPLNLFFVLICLKTRWRPATKYYHLLISAWLILFVAISSFLPQKFHPAFYVLAAILLTRSVAHSVMILKERALRK